MSTHVFAYNRSHTSVFASDNLRNVLRDIVTWSGLDQTDLLDSWSGPIGEAVRTWLRTGDLESIILEFYVAGNDNAVARWDFPISYDGSGVENDMWVAKEFVRRTIEKSQKPPSHAKYRVVLMSRPGRPDVYGISSTTLRGTSGLSGRLSGTAIATPDIMASLMYWKPT